ncbi:O-antigen ligase family protein [Candidatus Uhrbacteria bacterium]|nr:O-antigen ligase family protein [Candidatus Uhrbacteria bacterium]
MPSSIKKILLWIIYLSTATILALPLFVSKNTLFPYIFGKIIFFRIFAEIAFAAWVTLALFCKEYRPRWRHPLTLSFTVFIGILFVTMITGADPWNSFWSTQERMTGVLTFLHFWAWYMVLAHTIKGWAQWRSLFLWSISVSIASILYGVFANKQLFITTLGNSIYVGAYAILNLFFAIIISWKERNRWLRSFLAVSMLLNFGAMLGAGSRSVFYSFALALGVYALFMIFRLAGARLRVRLAAGIAVFFFLFVGLYFIMQSPGIKEWGKANLPYTLNRVFYSQSANEDRIVLWKIGLQGFVDRPFLGWGWENYNAPYEKHLVPRPYMEPWYDRSHNQLIDVLALTGIVGFLAYLFFWGSLGFVLFKKARELSSRAELGSLGALGAFFLFYFLQNLTIFDNPAPLFVFFFTLAFATSATVSSQAKNESSEGGIQGRGRLFLSLGVVFALAFAMYQWNINPFLKSSEGINGYFLLQNNDKSGLRYIRSSLEGDSFTDNEILSQVVALFMDTMAAGSVQFSDQEQKYWLSFLKDELQEQTVLHPYNLKNYLALASIYTRYAGFDPSYLQKAEETAKQVLAISPLRREGYTQMSEFKRTQRDFSASLEYAKKALELGAERDLPYLHWLTAISYIDTGDVQNAFSEMDAAERLGYPIYYGSGLAIKLAQIVSSAPKHSRIIPYIEVGVMKDPSNFYFLAARIIAYHNIGQKERAEKLLNDLESRDKNIGDQVKLFFREDKRD